MSNVLVGCVNNITQHKNNIKIWIESFKKYCTDKIVLVTVNAKSDELSYLHQLGVHTYPYIMELNETINNIRLKLQYETIKILNVDYVLVTDVFDVVFQGNPFTKIIDKDIVVGWEGVKHSEEPWNMDVLQKSYPNKVNDLKNHFISCSGVMGGKKDKMVELLNIMDVVTMNKDGHNIRDQAALNIIIQEEYFDITTLNPSDGWVLHCAVGGPTQFYKDWGFQKHIRERFGEAKMINGIVTTQHNIVYDIVHQFNRIEEWNRQLTTPYLG